MRRSSTERSSSVSSERGSGSAAPAKKRGGRTRVIQDTTFLEEDDAAETLKEFMKRTVSEKFVDNLPLDTLKVTACITAAATAVTLVGQLCDTSFTICS